MPIRRLPKELQEKAEKELNEVPTRIQEDLDNIKQWISKQPHLQIKRGDQWFLSYLRGSKFSLQLAKQKFNVYCTMRIRAPQFFGNRDPFQPELQEFFNRGIFIILPEMSSLLVPRRFLIRAKNSDPEKVPITISIKALVMIVDILTLEDDACVINGQEVVFDLKEAPYNYLAQFTPSILKNIIIFMQHAYSTRFKGIHFINVPSFLSTLLQIFKSLLPEKLRDRVYFYSESDIEKLDNFVPKSALPEEYGGKAGTIEKLTNDLKLKIESYSEWFIEDSQYNFKESDLQILKVSSEIFHTEESFRKLNID